MSTEPTLAAGIDRARILIEALPYIERFAGKTLVIKYGGSLISGEERHTSFAKDIALLKYVGINPVIVHGGGKEISRWMSRLGKESVFIEGLRYTDPETMEITEMILSGKIGKEIATSINRNGGKAVSLSGKDGGLLVAKRIQSKAGADLGLVGDIESVDVHLLEVLTEAGYIPVISSIASTKEGDTLNMNADYVAAGIAGALEAQKLIYMTDVDGIKKDGALVSSLDVPSARELLKHPDIKGGMLPKLECCLKALEAGAKQVHIINGTIQHSVLLEVFTNLGIGTMIARQTIARQPDVKTDATLGDRV